MDRIVKNHLITQGIPDIRLTALGFGDSKLPVIKQLRAELKTEELN
ncbi:hypothetical protein [Flavobacterium sp. HJJ]|nr:hypothetical protein [Flavobacterium sp. HJJ]MBF4470842.1 hypothetical protein [Flavobacterium sp. HJJ]